MALADLCTIAHRTALTGTSVLLDAVVLCPGLHRQQSSPELNGGEYPAVAAMTTGYVFRVENPATVLYLQSVGRTGQLTNVSVVPIDDAGRRWSKLLSIFYTYQNASFISSVAYLAAACVTFAVLVVYFLSGDWWGVFVVLVLIFARLCNIIIIRRRSKVDWGGAREPGVQGDLLILLSQDRWVRMRGAVDHLKAVTSGQWLREMSFVESSFAALATVLVYLDAALASNVSQVGKVLLIVLLIGSAGLLAIANKTTHTLQMRGNLITVNGPRKSYHRRLEMAHQLIQETERKDWALSLGLITSKSCSEAKSEWEGPVTM